MIDKKKACALSGHRVVSKNVDEKEVKNLLYKSINDGFDTFLCGMALGFDTLCFKLLLELKETNDIKIIACVPCKDQDAFFTKKQKESYRNFLEKADRIICLSPEYFDGCMQLRNQFMIDNASRVIAYLNCSYGGTYNTVKYAVERGVEVVYVNK